MSKAYRQLVDNTKLLLSAITREYKKGNNSAYVLLVLGVGPYQMETYPGFGHNYQAVVDALHEFYSEEKDSMVPEGFTDGLMQVFPAMAEMKCATLVTETLLYELKKESGRVKSFKLDMDGLLNAWSYYIEENKLDLIKEYPEVEKWIAHNKKAFENYGYIVK